MKLVPFSHHHLRLNEALPFGVRDESGQLLLAAGQLVPSAERLTQLTGMALFADEVESSEWRRRLNATVSAMLIKNVSLRTIAQALPTDDDAPRADAEVPLPDQWEDLTSELAAVLRDARPDPAWVPRVDQVMVAARRLGQSRPDGSLYYLIYSAGHSTERYSAQHSLLTQLVCDQAAAIMGWSPERTDALARAALTMNLAITRLQDRLARIEASPTAEDRAEIARHSARGAELLRDCGVDDPLWLDTVAHHHDPRLAGPLARWPAAAQLSQLLMRVDIFTAKLSRRRTRPPMSPVQAASQACLGADGRPDEIGAALLKAVGLYPPGSFVELVSGELGVVMSRGASASQPLVAGVVTPAGMPFGEPPLRNTADARFKVRAAVAASAVKVRQPHARLLALL